MCPQISAVQTIFPSDLGYWVCPVNASLLGWLWRRGLAPSFWERGVDRVRNGGGPKSKLKAEEQLLVFCPAFTHSGQKPEKLTQAAGRSNAWLTASRTYTQLSSRGMGGLARPPPLLVSNDHMCELRSVDSWRGQAPAHINLCIPESGLISCQVLYSFWAFGSSVKSLTPPNLSPKGKMVIHYSKRVGIWCNG